jgi:hypothetical protein
MDSIDEKRPSRASECHRLLGRSIKSCCGNDSLHNLALRSCGADGFYFPNLYIN